MEGFFTLLVDYITYFTMIITTRTEGYYERVNEQIQVINIDFAFVWVKISFEV